MTDSRPDSSLVSSRLAVVLDRQTRMLRSAMGPAIAKALEDPEIVEILCNPDGSLWFDRLGSGRAPSGLKLTSPDAERIIRLVASHVRREVHAAAPIISAEVPETGERFEGLLPPIVRAPTFAIRKRAAGVIPLDRYVADHILTTSQADTLRLPLARTLEHPDRRSHKDGENNTRQRFVAGNRPYWRSRHHPGGHDRAAVPFR